MANWFIGFPVSPGPGLEGSLRSAPVELVRQHPADLHVTLAFLGKCGEPAARAAFAQLARMAIPRFDAQPSAMIALGPEPRRSAFGLQLRGRALTEWIGRVRPLLLTAAGAGPDRYPVLPHVTLARPERAAPSEVRAEAERWASGADVPRTVFKLDRIALYTWAEPGGDTEFQIIEVVAAGGPAPCTYEGGCHCGAVRFSVTVRSFEALDCNCSICHKKGILHVIVDEDDFTLHTASDRLSTYTFGTHTAKHHFCSVCGMHPFYRPRSHPHAWDVNARCLDGDAIDDFVLVPFDGQRWEENVQGIQ